MRYLKTNLKKRREKYQEKQLSHRIKKSERADMRRLGSETFAHYVTRLHQYAQDNPDDVDAYGKAIKAKNMLQNKQGVPRFV